MAYEMEEYKYFAFISYSSLDMKWGKRLQSKLENYKIPAKLCGKYGWARQPMKPVFYAPSDIQPGGLTEELQQRLKASRNLIVLCSPHSAQSYWVGKEIEFFHQLGRTKQVLFFIVAGVPHSGDPDTECFNPIVSQLDFPEMLGANINEKIYRWPWLNKERAYVQLVSKLLHVEYDTIWQRHKRQLASRMATWSVMVLVVLAIMGCIWTSSQPFDASIQIHEAPFPNNALPPFTEAAVELRMDKDGKTRTIHSSSDQITFKDIPHRYLDKPVRILVKCRGYIDVDTVLALGRAVSLDIRRDPSVYGGIHFHIWDPKTEKTVPNVSVEIGGFKAVSDQDGLVELNIPLEAQQAQYPIVSSIPLVADTVYMPCGEDDVVMRK